MNCLSKRYMYLVKGQKISKFRGQYTKASRYFREALSHFQEALNSTPNDPLLLRNCARVLFVTEKTHIQNELFRRKRDKVDSSSPPPTLSLKSRLLTRANNYFNKAILATGMPEVTLITEYACFLEDCGELDAAETTYLSSLLQNPNQHYCLQRYGNFLEFHRKDEVNGEMFLMRMNQVKLLAQKKAIEALNAGNDSSSELKVDKAHN